MAQPSLKAVVPVSGNLAQRAMEEAGFKPSEDASDILDSDISEQDTEQAKQQNAFTKAITQSIAAKKAKMPQPHMEYVETRPRYFKTRDPVRVKPGPELENMAQFMREPETAIPQIINRNLEGTSRTLEEGMFRRAEAMRK